MRFLFFLFVLAIFPSFAYAQKNTFYVNKIHDYSQTRLAEIIENYSSGAFCAPTSASNILKTFHGGRFIDQGEMIKTLASPDYMNTHPDNGTTTQDFISGLSKYIEDYFGKGSIIEYQGFDRSIADHTGIIRPQIDWIKDGLGMHRATWLTLHRFLYDPDTKTYELMDGHMVTLTGYTITPRSKVLIINDSAAPADARARSDHLKLKKMKGGTLSYGEYLIPAKGFMRVIETSDPSYNAANKDLVYVLTGALRLELE